MKNISQNKLTYILIPLLILAIGIVIFISYRNKNSADYSIYKVHPATKENTTEMHAPENYEAICVYFDSSTLMKSNYASKNRSDYRVSETTGNTSDLNDKWSSLFKEIFGENKAQIKLLELQYKELYASNHAIYTVDDIKSWDKLSDEEKYNLLQRMNSIVIKQVMNDEKYELKPFSTILYSCNDTLRPKWIGFARTKVDGTTEIFFDWNNYPALNP